jgi:predicted ATPase
LTQGRRTAVARHQTLKAALDWSYQHLSDLEKSVLQRLAVFRMAFTQEAAIGVISGDGVPVAELIEVLDKIALKSLLYREQGAGVTRYRFLNTTRTYALEKLELSGQLRALEMRYAGQVPRVSGGQVAL